jgi:hypothetical protein
MKEKKPLSYTSMAFLGELGARQDLQAQSAGRIEFLNLCETVRGPAEVYGLY